MGWSHIDPIIRILRREIRRWEEPIVGHYKEDPFTVLIGCLLSLRTQDKTTAGACERLFAKAQTPQAMLGLAPRQIERLIYPVCFYRNKARTILRVCRLLLEDRQGRVPDEIDELLKLPGVGRKTANLVVTLGYDKPGICVDTHVHRISNRLGLVRTKTPEETEFALRKKLPRKYWIEYNDLLVSYGQNLCKPISPICSQCKIRRFCPRIGVGISR
jgi:endonuclease-3